MGINVPGPTMTLAELNAMPAAAFTAALAPVFENAPWVAAGIVAKRPFVTLSALHRAMMALIGTQSTDAQTAFLRGHPRLAPETLRNGTTVESTAEQTAAGIGTLDDAKLTTLSRLNAAYDAKFGFPFILAVRRASLPTLLATFERRLAAGLEAERAEALTEIAAISWMRLLDRVEPAPTGSLSTHVLDTVRAAPAVGLGVELWRVDGEATCLESFVTDDNGASSRELLSEGRLRAGTYEWRYDTPTYFAAIGYPTQARSFLGKVSVTFSVWNPEEHFHVPLLLTPGSYTTYRGS
ncbi:MAG: 2-oxo-4-hydroxy-4-carboxy-5-ureidoimidazoline decarboxylase [Proteobacteria bacterium]|nr:2-oxo-4-hydroxy-4-carboxy-5-ureidoimidazoline decarboxylase [Pseudomonadota bacterium]